MNLSFALLILVKIFDSFAYVVKYFNYLKHRSFALTSDRLMCSLELKEAISGNIYYLEKNRTQEKETEHQ